MATLDPGDEVVRLTPVRKCTKVHLPSEDDKPRCRYKGRRTQLNSIKRYRVSTWAAVKGHFELCERCEKLLEEDG